MKLKNADPPATKVVARVARQDVKAEKNRVAVQKHRANRSEQKKKEVREKRMAYYYRKKEEKALELKGQEAGIQDDR